MPTPTLEHVAPLRGFVGAARRYWLRIFPSFLKEMRRWEARASRIEDRTLRALALDAQRAKRRSLEGAVAFAVFAPPLAQRHVIRALVTYQVIFDFLDTVAEQHNDDPIKNGRQLNRAMLAALEPATPLENYYAHCRGDDGGYLRTLIEHCRRALLSLPSFETVRVPLRYAVERNIAYQSLNHGDANHSYHAFDNWARQQVRPATELSWWETGAAAGSSLSVLALISNAANVLTSEEAACLDAAYYPWIGALHTLLDSLVDRTADTAAVGQRSLMDYYPSDAEAALRLSGIAAQALRKARELPMHPRHELIVAAMVSYYLSEPEASSVRAAAARREVLASLGTLAIPTMLVMQARGWASKTRTS